MYSHDVDIMGYQRGAHKDGPDVCEKFQFTKPGGHNEDGSVLWGWSDKRGVDCSKCGCRDSEHVILKDLPAVEQEKQAAKKREAAAAKAQAAPPAPAARAPEPIEEATKEEGLLAKDVGAPIQMFELDAGVPDPLALNAWRDAQRENAAKAQKAQKAAMQSAVTSALSSEAGVAAATGGEPAGMPAVDEETERFKAEV